MKLKILIRSALVLLVAALLIAPLACHRGVQEAAQQYYCPMHPDYHSDKPGDCPICGMRLVPVNEKDAEQDSASHVKTMYRSTMNPSEISERPGKDSMGTSFMPQMGQSPGLSEVICGCIGQWYLATTAAGFF